MTSLSIISQFNYFRYSWAAKRLPRQRPNLHQLAQQPEKLPRFVRQTPVAMRYLRLLSPLAWDQFPERNLLTKKGFAPVPYAPFVGACLIKLDQHLLYSKREQTELFKNPRRTLRVH
jgi:hypothetical protein